MNSVEEEARQNFFRQNPEVARAWGMGHHQ